MDLLSYEADFPERKGDTETYELLVSAGDVEQPLQVLGKEVTMAEFEVPEDSTVVLKITPLDNKGNRGPTGEQTFVAQDTIGPEAPGPFGEIRLTGERTVPDA